MSFFSEEKENNANKKIYLGIIGLLLIINVVAFKAIVAIASNKTVTVQVPYFMDSGEYVISNSDASDNTYKMWAKVWINELANFSYKDIRQKIEDIFPFLDPKTAFESKSNMIKVVEFIEANFITQEFTIKEIKISKINKVYKKITIDGRIKRTIGKKEDDLSGLKYTYEFVVFVRNGQIYINSFQSNISEATDKLTSKKLLENEFVDFKSVVDSAKKEKEEEAKQKKEKANLK